MFKRISSVRMSTWPRSPWWSSSWLRACVDTCRDRSHLCLSVWCSGTERLQSALILNTLKFHRVNYKVILSGNTWNIPPDQLNAVSHRYWGHSSTPQLHLFPPRTWKRSRRASLLWLCLCKTTPTVRQLWEEPCICYEKWQPSTHPLWLKSIQNPILSPLRHI